MRDSKIGITSALKRSVDFLTLTTDPQQIIICLTGSLGSVLCFYTVRTGDLVVKTNHPICNEV